MMALIDNYMAVAGNQVVDYSFADEALNHGHVEMAVGSALTAADLADCALIDTEEHRELRYPLVEERLPVNKDQRATRSLSDQVRSQDSLANAGRSNKHAGVVCEYGPCCLSLRLRQIAFEREIDQLAILTLVVHDEHCAMGAERFLYGRHATTW
jgi:hypothetical protein